MSRLLIVDNIIRTLITKHNSIEKLKQEAHGPRRSPDIIMNNVF